MEDYWYDHPVEEWRIKCDFTQKEFCEMAGLSLSQYNDVTRSCRSSFGRQAMHRIVDATDGDVSYRRMMEWDREMHWEPDPQPRGKAPRWKRKVQA